MVSIQEAQATRLGYNPVSLRSPFGFVNVAPKLQTQFPYGVGGLGQTEAGTIASGIIAGIIGVALLVGGALGGVALGNAIKRPGWGLLIGVGVPLLIRSNITDGFSAGIAGLSTFRLIK